VAQNPDLRKVTVASDDGVALRAAAIVADASRALWADDAALALPHIAELLVAEGFAARAVLDISDDGGALRGEARSAASSSGTGGTISVPIVASQRPIGSIAVDLPPQPSVAPEHVTVLLKHLAQFIGPAVAAHHARAGERVRLTDENSRLRNRLHGRHDLTSIIGNSEAMRLVCELVTRAAPTGTPVLLEGEAGTGKEFLARTLHHSSPWARRPFVEVQLQPRRGEPRSGSARPVPRTRRAQEAPAAGRRRHPLPRRHPRAPGHRPGAADAPPATARIRLGADVLGAHPAGAG
jgi:transcriptional regulator with GAF, ATPase, and Fis domain